MQKNNFNLLKEVKSDGFSLPDAVAVLQLIENSRNRGSNYRSTTIYII